MNKVDKIAMHMHDGGEIVDKFSKLITGKRIRQVRQHLGYSREQFAEQVKISPQFLAEIENGKKSFSAETLYKICKSCSISSDYILFGENRFGSDNLITKLFNKVPDYKRSDFEEMMKTVSNMLISEDAAKNTEDNS